MCLHKRGCSLVSDVLVGRFRFLCRVDKRTRDERCRGDPKQCEESAVNLNIEGVAFNAVPYSRSYDNEQGGNDDNSSKGLSGTWTSSSGFVR